MESSFTSTILPKSVSALKAVALTGLLAGTLDIISALTMYSTTTGKNPMNVLRYISSGVVGPSAFTGGLPMALLGLLLHFFIAYTFTLVFFLLYPRLPILAKNKVIVGLLYGVVIWLVMDLIVLPLFFSPRSPLELWYVIKGMSILMVMVGLPISVLTNRYYSSK
jgi:hypothetical protein